jgi:hypothetical protein
MVHSFTTRYIRPEKCNFHYNKQHWTTQQLASTPTVCTATRTNEATATRRHRYDIGIHEPAKQQQQKGGAEAGGGGSGAEGGLDGSIWDE